MSKELLSAEQKAELEQIAEELTFAQENGDIVDQGVNVLRIVIILEDAFGDGFQLIEDILKLVGAEPLVKDIILRGSKAIEAITKLDDDLASEVGLSIYNKALSFTKNREFGAVSTWIVNTFLLSGFAYEKLMDVIDTVNEVIEGGRLYISKGDLAAYVEEKGTV